MTLSFMNTMIDQINYLRLSHFVQHKKLIEGIPLKFLSRSLQFLYSKFKVLNKTYPAWNAMVHSNFKMMVVVKNFSEKTKTSTVNFDQVKNINVYPCFNRLIEKKLKDDKELIEIEDSFENVRIAK